MNDYVQPPHFLADPDRWDRLALLDAWGWERQDIPGLWRHATIAHGFELTTSQAISASLAAGCALDEAYRRA